MLGGRILRPQAGSSARKILFDQIEHFRGQSWLPGGLAPQIDGLWAIYEVYS
jgi:hypothetical protein